MKKPSFRFFAADFETTVYKGQKNTLVWSAASVEFGTEDVVICHSIDEQFNYFLSLDCNICAYFHNLKFDGCFWLSYLLTDLHYNQAFEKLNEEGTKLKWLTNKEMPNGSFRYSISDMGQWYSITIKQNNHIIEFRDSMKLLPFTLMRIGESFKTKHKKLEMEYTGFRYPGCPISKDEEAYIANDVLVLKEALEFMFGEGHKKLTIGSCCLAEYRKIIGDYMYKEWFPDVYEMPLDESEHRYKTVGEWVHRAYRGGWCYLVKGKENQIKHNGTTADVNSLYPSMMSSESGNCYPVGKPIFWSGNYIPYDMRSTDCYWFVRIKTRFYVKNGYLPFIQIKGTWLYPPNTALESSDVYDKEKKKYVTHYKDFDGTIKDTRVELTLTMTDFNLLVEHYNLVDFEILDGCCFKAEKGIFDDYIEKYKKIKLESKGAMRELAKLFLNNLYGKMASSTNSSYKVAYVKDDGSIGFYEITEDDKKPGYIPVGAAITSYARNFTIRAAQKNYHGADKPGFIYADTDSIHCDLKPEELVGITVHDKNFCCWKLESCWDIGLFVRQKTYIEHITHENLQPVEKQYYNVKCAGMPEKCKNLFISSVTGEIKPLDKFTDSEEEEKKFLYDENGNQIKRELTDFKVGLVVPGKLRPVRIPGGCLLMETSYEMR